MSKSAKHNRQSELKSHEERSHNPDLALIAFVKFLARKAAEEDYKTLQESMPNQIIKGEE